MSDERILYKFLNLELADDHPALYLFCVGKEKSKKTATKKVVDVVVEIFCPPYTVEFIKKTVTNFLEYKKLEYKEGNIKITPIYQ